MESSLNAPRRTPGKEERGTHASTDPKTERLNAVKKVIDQEIRPYIQADGGDIEVLAVDGLRVTVKLLGACVTCPSSMMTLRSGVQARLQARIDKDMVVEQVD